MVRLVLFDVDKTLIKGFSKGHRKAFSEAFRKVYGINTNVDIIPNHSGMTDQETIFEVLKRNGIDKKTAKLKIKDCMKAMIESYKKLVKGDEIVVLDGVRKLLEEMKKHKILMVLITGNLEPIARAKLKKIGINHYFLIGGFGSDDINRINIVKIAIKRAKKNFNFKFKDNVFLVGDNPREIKAGKEAKIKTIGVATGLYSVNELKKAGADFVLKDLKDTDKILKIILHG